MSRLLHYYEDYINPTNGHRERFWFRAAYADYYTSGGSVDTSRPTGGIPAFGDTVGNERWKPLPTGFYKKTSGGGEYGYDDLPVGVFEPPSRAFRFDLEKLYEDGDAELEAVAGYMKEGRNPTTGYFVIENGLTTATFEAVNIYKIVSDGGDSSLDIGLFETLFVGGQERAIEQPIDINEVSGEAIIDIDAVDMTRVIFSRLTPAHLYDHIRLTTDYLSYAVEVEYIHNYIYGASTGETLTPGFYTHRWGGNDQRFLCYELRIIWTGINYLASVLYKAMMGQETGTTFNIRVHSGIGLPDDVGLSGGNNGASAMLKLFQAMNNATGEASATEADPRFCGRIYLSTDTATDVGGWLYPAEKGGAHRWKTLWDMLKDAVEGSSARAILAYSTIDTCTLIFDPLEYADLTTVTLDTPRIASPVLRKGIIAGAEAEISEASGNDLSDIEHLSWGTQEDKKRTIPVWFHNQPLVGDVNEADGQMIEGYVVIDYPTIGEQDFTAFVMTTPHFPINILLYYSPLELTPGAFGDDVSVDSYMQRVHHRVRIRTDDDGTLTDDCINGIELPTPDQGEDIIAEFWHPLRLVALQTQQMAGMTFAICAYVSKLFSRWTQYGIEIDADSFEVRLNRLGYRASLGVSGWKPYLSDLSDTPFITKVTEEEGASKLSVIGIGVPE